MSECLYKKKISNQIKMAHWVETVYLEIWDSCTVIHYKISMSPRYILWKDIIFFYLWRSSTMNMYLFTAIIGGKDGNDVVSFYSTIFIKTYGIYPPLPKERWPWNNYELQKFNT